MDLNKEFEIRHKKREQEKQAKLEELYEKHDKRALEFKGIIATGMQSTPQGGIESEESTAIAKQAEEAAYGAMMEEMKAERDKLIEHFNKDTDLKEKIIITGVK